MEQAEVRRLHELVKENSRLKRQLAHRDVEIDVIKKLLNKKVGPTPARRGFTGRSRDFMPPRLLPPGTLSALAHLS